MGSYSVSAELLGLVASKPEVPVYVNRTSDVALILREAEEAPGSSTVEDWIQVIAEAPVIDCFDTRVGANVSLEFLYELPVERFYQSVALLLPGVSGRRRQSRDLRGAAQQQPLPDRRRRHTDPTTGLFGLNLTYEAIQEVQVTTAAPPAEYGRSSGAVINVVTRSEGNRYRGVARWVPTYNDSGDYDASSPELGHLAGEIEATNSGPDSLDSTVARSLGGPLWRDRLWFFAAHEDSERSFLRPTLEGTPWDVDTEVASSAFKLTWQATPQRILELQPSTAPWSTPPTCPRRAGSRSASCPSSRSCSGSPTAASSARRWTSWWQASSVR